MATPYVAITPDEKQSIMDAIAKVRSIIPQMPVVESRELKRTPSMDNTRSPFVSQALTLAKAHVELVPPFTDINESMAYFKLCGDLDEIGAEMAEVTKLIEHTRRTAGSKSYQTGLSIYDVTKRGAKKGIPIMITAAAQLKVFFERVTSDKKKSTGTAKKS